MDIKHFKLANGEEVICEVVDWDNEETRDIVIRKALRVEPKTTDTDAAYKYYTFSPWMAMQDSLNMLQTLNSDQVISVATPSQTALDYFADVINEVSGMSEGPEMYEEIEMDSAETETILLH